MPSQIDDERDGDRMRHLRGDVSRGKPSAQDGPHHGVGVLIVESNACTLDMIRAHNSVVYASKGVSHEFKSDVNEMSLSRHYAGCAISDQKKVFAALHYRVAEKQPATC